MHSMEINLFKAVIAATLLSIASSAAQAQDAKDWEIGLGGALVNMNRTTVSNFHQTPGGDYVFNVKEKMAYGGGEIYLSHGIKPWLYLDLQGTLGMARYFEGSGERQGFSCMAGPGLQIRPFTGSRWIQPYLRLGLNYYHKNFSTRYFGQFDGDPTKEGIWKAEDAWNKGLTVDHDDFVPIGAGIGVIGWMSDRVGLRLQGQYLAPLLLPGQNFAQISAGVLLRLGGSSKKKHYEGFISKDGAEVREVVKEVIREVPVERVVEVVKEVPRVVTLTEMMDNVNFEFDSAEITPESASTLDAVAEVLRSNSSMHFLIAGYTDSKGSDEYNDALSESRAAAVVEALVSRGVPASSLCSRGFGKRMAVVPQEESDEARKGDRKVVVERILDDTLWKYMKR